MVNDRYGIPQFYPTATGGEEVYRDNLSLDGDTNEYFYVYTSMGYDEPTVNDRCKRQYDLWIRHWIQHHKDWKNVEVTAYIFLDRTETLAEEFDIMTRTGRHRSWYWCAGCSYKFKYGYDGRVTFVKEQWHRHHAMKPWVKVTGSLLKRWLGVKIVLYNMVVNERYRHHHHYHDRRYIHVKAEFYIDENESNQWKKVYETIDAGGWGTRGDICGGDPDQIITWGGPAVVLHIDKGKLNIKKMSVREIYVANQDPENPPSVGTVRSTIQFRYGVIEAPVPDIPDIPGTWPTPEGYIDAFVSTGYNILGDSGGFPEEPAPPRTVFRSSRHRYAIGHFSTTHCFTG